MKVYVQTKRLTMVGKASDICQKLKEYCKTYDTVDELIKVNQAGSNSRLSCKHDHNSFVIVHKSKKTKKQLSFLWVPKKSK